MRTQGILARVQVADLGKVEIELPFHFAQRRQTRTRIMRTGLDERCPHAPVRIAVLRVTRAQQLAIESGETDYVRHTSNRFTCDSGRPMRAAGSA